MALKKPLALYSGRIKELQAGDTLPQTSSSYGFIVGPTVTWSGLTATLAPAIYNIGGVTYSASGSTTLAAADATFGRFDLLVVDTTGVFGKITGTPAATPAIPTYDPSLYLAVTPVFLGAGATSPTLTQVLVYNENAEWTFSATNLTADANNTTAPYVGTKDIDVTAGNTGGYLKFVNASLVYATNYQTFSFFLRLKAALNNQKNLSVSFWNGNTQVSNTVTPGTTNGLDKNITGSYQAISINLSDFNFTNAAFDTIRISYTFNSFVGFYVDYLQLTNNSNSGGNTIVYQKASVAEINTGTDDSKYTTPLGLEGSKYISQSLAKISATASGINTYTASLVPAITSYATTLKVFIKFPNANTANATLSLNGLAVNPILKADGSQMGAGEIPAGSVQLLAVNNANFQVIGGGGVSLSTINQKINSLAININQSII